ncbi:hypothetical protein BAUCODRAFT_35141 [Baudoinia panamericana UAMH 10762]|uniref:Uncharacterized protein n=1 Tax=Baudoinia panamericana (strain UAMH 10762) TaxID=717646 RepID=M2N7U4_BAUPA|nr:uncharacterized protein BAUCODRAFT_35141 [Baudoinia panamericana UAMH 10762]EMC95149.1 hypothetical protein BAUCODRAFT_35141 [Baudoinia panamericana UAMH 10762]
MAVSDLFQRAAQVQDPAVRQACQAGHLTLAVAGVLGVLVTLRHEYESGWWPLLAPSKSNGKRGPTRRCSQY